MVQNGIGYDTYMNKIEAASPSSTRKVIVVQNLLGLPDSTPNPHLWYSPRPCPRWPRPSPPTSPACSRRTRPTSRPTLRTFDASLQPWYQAIAQFKAAYPGTPVAVTEPVGDYMLQAVGAKILTPFGLQADIMNGVDPSPQDVSLEDGLFAQHKVKVFVYNQQVTDSLTASFLLRPARTASRWSACTRPCRRPDTTTSRGCSPRCRR